MKLRPPLILVTFARPVWVLIVAASVWVLLRGHDAPGGGFIAGLIAASATVLRQVAGQATGAPRPALLERDLRLAATGLALALLAGLPGFVAGNDWLRQLWAVLPGGVTVSTVLVFDLGVYLCVWGTASAYVGTLLVVSADEEGA